MLALPQPPLSDYIDSGPRLTCYVLFTSYDKRHTFLAHTGTYLPFSLTARHLDLMYLGYSTIVYPKVVTLQICFCLAAFCDFWLRATLAHAQVPAQPVPFTFHCYPGVYPGVHPIHFLYILYPDSFPHWPQWL